MIDYTQSFQEFSKSVTSMDLALYAGVGIVLWVLFKDKLSPVQKFISDLLNKTKGVIESSAPSVVKISNGSANNADENFFELVISWKKTRDLAVKIGCDQAVSVADEMFPFLSPNACNKKNENKSEKVQP